MDVPAETGMFAIKRNKNSYYKMIKAKWREK